MKKLALFLCSVLSLTGVATAKAQDGKIKGYMFGDYYAVLAADDAEAKLPEKRNAFQFRRIYLTYEKTLAENFSVRYRLEAKDAGFSKGTKMEPFVKHGYLKWKRALGSSDLYLGLSGTRNKMDRRRKDRTSSTHFRLLRRAHTNLWKRTCKRTFCSSTHLQCQLHRHPLWMISTM